LQTSARDALHHPAKAGRKGHGVDGRRSGSTKSPSFDEAAVEAGLVLPHKERDRGRQRRVRDRPGGRIRHKGRSAHRKALDQEPTGPSGAGPLGKPRDIDDPAKARGSPSSKALPEVTSFAKASAGRATVEAITRGESRRWGDSGIERFTGCSCCNVDCRSWVDVSSLLGRSALKGVWSHLRVA